MAIPVLTPKAAPLQLPTDIMARIAAAAQAQSQARGSDIANIQKLQQLHKTKQGLQQSQQAFPLMQRLKQAQIAHELAATQGIVSPQQKPTSTELAFNAWKQALTQDPTSLRTAALGQALKKALQTSQGASITTPGGTTVTLGGAAPTSGAFFPQAGQTLGGQPQPTGAQQQLTPQQQAIQAVFGGPQQPSPVSQVAGIGGSRKQQGITLVDPLTGQVTSTPTRQVTTLNQQAVESAQKLMPIIDKIASGYAPFAGVAGKGHEIFDKVLSGLDLDKDASDKILRLNEAQDEGKFGVTDLIRTIGGKPTVEELKNFSSIFKPRFGENPDVFKQRMIQGVKDAIATFAGTAAAAQTRGIKLGTIKPGTLQFDPAVREGSISIAPQTQQTQEAQQPSQEDLEFTAKKKGMTVDQVKQQLGIK